VAAAVIACGVVLQSTGPLTTVVAGAAAAAGVVSAVLAWHAARHRPGLTGAASAAVGGVAVGLLGFAVASPLLDMTGALVLGTALALRRMGRAASGPTINGYHSVSACDPEEAAMVLEAARRVMIVPGYGMALAQAHHALKELADRLTARGGRVDVCWVIHPAAGRIPGHMNVLLDEANVAQADLLDVAAANARLRAGDVDVALVVGADDIVNPDALRDDDGPLYGLEIIESHLARAVLVIKPTLAPPESGARNPLFDKPNTTMVFGDAKRVLGAVIAELKNVHRAVA
jgi:NAD(P) transhydrogenase subunit beta